jgi:NAD(P)-dependent dehydrogenase (short-subunit alcohol dehydrogenase family)
MSAKGSEFEGKVVVVTGGNRGIGLAICRRFAAAGARLAICGRDEAALDTAHSLLAQETDCFAATCDLADAAAVERFSKDVLGRFGSVDVVVANAGGVGPASLLHETSWGDWRECIASNLDATFLTFKAFVPTMIAQGHGSLIAFASVAGKKPIEGRSAYGAAKLAIVGLVRALAVEVGRHGINVNAISPGGVEGERFSGNVRRLASVSGRSEEAVRADFSEATPMRRLVSADDVAGACLFLASRAAAAITGEDLNVSNGLVMY